MLALPPREQFATKFDCAFSVGTKNRQIAAIVPGSGCEAVPARNAALSTLASSSPIDDAASATVSCVVVGPVGVVVPPPELPPPQAATTIAKNSAMTARRDK